MSIFTLVTRYSVRTANYIAPGRLFRFLGLSLAKRRRPSIASEKEVARGLSNSVKKASVLARPAGQENLRDRGWRDANQTRRDFATRPGADRIESFEESYRRAVDLRLSSIRSRPAGGRARGNPNSFVGRLGDG